MTGYHEVRVFRVYDADGMDLPEGWKPFAGTYVAPPFCAPFWEVICRKWHRQEKA